MQGMRAFQLYVGVGTDGEKRGQCTETFSSIFHYSQHISRHQTSQEIIASGTSTAAVAAAADTERP
jgi:hypothetical protein